MRSERLWTEIDRTGTITNETFQRAFPEWKALATLDWNRNRWASSFALRYIHGMTQTSGNILSSRTFADLNVRYEIPLSSNSLTAVLGFKS